MKPYAFHKKAQGGSVFSKLITHVTMPRLDENEVQRHVGLLVGQAIFLVLLALVYIGFEAYTVNLEAQVIDYPKSILERPQQLAEAKPQKPLEAVLGTEEMRQLLLDASKKEEKQDIYLQKESFVIALTGDSIIETMGKDAPKLEGALKEKYPDTHFFIYNYAKGARNVSENLKDFHEPFHYKDRHYESIDKLQPDVIIVGSSAYNLFEPHDVNTHWLEYTRLVQEAIKVTPHVYMLAEPAPVGTGFGLGSDGVVWEPNSAWIHTGQIIEQIKNVLGLAETLSMPVIDTYTDSLDENGQRGKREFINTSDNIHLSEEGHEYVAKKIVETINFEEIR
jgi:hypothetical protein